MWYSSAGVWERGDSSFSPIRIRRVLGPSSPSQVNELHLCLIGTSPERLIKGKRGSWERHSRGTSVSPVKSANRDVAGKGETQRARERGTEFVTRVKTIRGVITVRNIHLLSSSSLPRPWQPPLPSSTPASPSHLPASIKVITRMPPRPKPVVRPTLRARQITI